RLLRQIEIGGGIADEDFAPDHPAKKRAHLTDAHALGAESQGAFVRLAEVEEMALVRLHLAACDVSGPHQLAQFGPFDKKPEATLGVLERPRGEVALAEPGEVVRGP